MLLTKLYKIVHKKVLLIFTDNILRPKICFNLRNFQVNFMDFLCKIFYNQNLCDSFFVTLTDFLKV